MGALDDIRMEEIPFLWKFIQVDLGLLVGAIFALASVLAPVLFVPAFLLVVRAILERLLAPREGQFYNIIDKSANNLPAASAAAAGSGSDGGKDADPLAIWKVAAPYAASPTSSSVPCPLMFLPAPWEDRASLLRIVGEDDAIDPSKSASWIGLDDAEGYAIRVEMSVPKRCKFVRVGRVDEQQPSAKTPFASEVPDPFSESATEVADVSADKRKAPLDAATRWDDTIRSGDIVFVVDQQSKKHLTVAGWWVLLSADAVTSNAYFIITHVNDAGDATYGAPVTAGVPFRLRSARYPRYEVGVQAQASIENRGNMLVMYEFSRSSSKGSVRWKQGGQVNPLFLCTLPDTMRTSLHPSVSMQRQHKWNIYGGIVSGLSYLRRHPIKNIRVMGHAEVLHRLLNKVFLVVVVVVTGSDEYGDKDWTCLKSFKDIDNMLGQVESRQDAALQKRGLADKRVEGHRPLHHESHIAQDIRLMNHRFRAALKLDAYARGVASAVFLTEFKHASLWDAWMLTGGMKELGAAPSSADRALGPALYTGCVARMMWESHIREEVCVLYATQLSCYPPLSARASWVLPLRDVVGLADVYLEESPLPGTYALRVETMGRIYYLSCRSYEARAVLRDSIAHQIAVLPPPTTKASPFSSYLGGASPDSFTHVSGQWLPSTRLILNARKFPFDTQSRSLRSWLRDESYWRLSEHLLQAASELELLLHERGSAAQDGRSNGGSEDDEGELKNRLLAFIDETTLLRLVDLKAVDLGSKEALCFFSNVFHTLLLHSRAVLRLPSKADWGLFFSSVSYSVGDDVFSLAELEQCVLRGKLSRPRVTSRHDPAVLPLSDSHFAYALDKADCRVNFMLNSGSVSNPESVYLLTPRNLEQQLNAASQVTLNHSMSVDFGYHTVTLPKLCEVYRGDLGDDADKVLHTCLKYLANSNGFADLESILGSGGRVPTIKYLLLTYESRSKLLLV